MSPALAEFFATHGFDPAKPPPAQAAAKKQERELSLFDFGNEAVQQAAGQRENRLQQAQLEIKRRFGKNAVLKGMSLLDGATAKERNEQIGGHKA